MKKIGIAAILIVMLLTVGVASALAASEKPENATITQIGPDTAKTGDGQILHKFTIKVDNETLIGKRVAGERPEEISITLIGPDTARTSDGQIIKKMTIKVDNETQTGKNVVVAGSDHIKIGVIHNPSSKGVSGSVAPGYADLWGPFSWSAGYPASVSATWTPTNQGVYLSIYDMANPSWAYEQLKTGGSGTYSRSVPYASSQWSYAIKNPASNAATINYSLT